jgi:hypothetical protein
MRGLTSINQLRDRFAINALQRMRRATARVNEAVRKALYDKGRDLE